MSTTFTSPRPSPSVLLPALAGSAVIALALPIFLVAGWPLDGWVIAATLWVASQLFGYLLVRMRSGGNLAASGVAAVGMLTRAVVVMGVIFVVAVSDPWVGLAAALTYALAYTVELILSLVAYYGNQPL
jgi:hypothetical protein